MYHKSNVKSFLSQAVHVMVKKKKEILVAVIEVTQAQIANLEIGARRILWLLIDYMIFSFYLR